ncbi:MAG: hypothetical protein HOP18_25130 [Deltaproteobacteria bacterium]|nr:hypothetical protein [Deltaproteobacteria bacterium]
MGFETFWRDALTNRAKNIGRPAKDLLPQIDDGWRQALQGLPALPLERPLLEQFNFPGRLALLATGTIASGAPAGFVTPELLQHLVQRAWDDPQIAAKVFSKEYLGKALEGILKRGEAPREWFLDREIRGELANAISSLTRERKIPLALTGDLLVDLLARKVARNPNLAELRISEDHVEDVLRLLAGKGNPFSGALPDHLGRLLPLVLEEAGGEFGIPVTPEDANAAVRLLLTGEFFQDAKYSVEVTLRTVPKLLVNAPKDVVKLPGRIFTLVKAMTVGVIHFPLEFPSFVRELAQSGNPPSSALLSQTLDWLYDTGTFRTAADLVWQLTAPDNESLRLALLAFARVNGAPVTAAHLDAVREIFHTDAPNLQPAITEGVKFLRTRFADRLPDMLTSFVS